MRNIVSYSVVKNIMDPTSVKTGTHPALVHLGLLLDDVCGEGTWGKYHIRVNKQRTSSPGLVLLPGDHVSVVVRPLAPMIMTILPSLSFLFTSFGYSVYNYIQMKAQMNKLKDEQSSTPATPSQAYGYDVKDNYRYDGEVVPVLFGETKMGGTIINQSILGPESGGHVETLKMILAVAEGEIDALAENGEEDIFLDDTPLTQYSNYEYDVRLGAAADTVFGDMTELVQQWFPDSSHIRSTGLFFNFDSDYQNKALNFKSDKGLTPDLTIAQQVGVSRSTTNKFGSNSLYLPNIFSFIAYKKCDNMHQSRGDPFAISFWMKTTLTLFSALADAWYYHIFWVQPIAVQDGEKYWSLVCHKINSDYLKFRFTVFMREDGGNWAPKFLVQTRFLSVADFYSAFVHVKFCRDSEYYAWFVNGVDVTNRGTNSIIEKDGNKIELYTWPEFFNHFIIGAGADAGFPCYLDEVRVDVYGNVSNRNFTPPAATELTDILTQGVVTHKARGTADQIYVSYSFPKGLYNYNPYTGEYDRAYSLYRESVDMGSSKNVYLFNHDATTELEAKVARAVYGEASGVLSKTTRIPFDYISVNHVGGHFEFGEDIVGGTSGDRGALFAVHRASASVLHLYLRGVSEGEFSAGETVTGASSGATAVVNAGGTVTRETSYDEITTDRRFLSSTNYRVTNLSKLHSIAEARRFSLMYPRVAKLFLSIEAQGGLTTIPRVSVIGKKTSYTAYYWNGTALVSFTSASKGYDLLRNPAWVVWVILTDGFFDTGTRYGEGWGRGIHPKWLDYTTFNAWASYCNTSVDGTKRVQFNGVFDVKGKKVLDAMSVAAVVGRGRINMLGNKYYVTIDRPTTPANTPSYVFSSGNTYNTRLTWIDPIEKPDKVVIEFLNEESKYSKDSKSSERSDYDSLTTSPEVDTIFVPGITNPDQAQREAHLRLQLARSMERMIEFDTDVEGLVIQPGTVIAFQHESNKYTIGGRLVSVSGGDKEIVLDREITLDSKLYSGDCFTYIRKSNDSVVKYTITGPFDEETDTFTTTETPTGAADNPFAIYRLTEDDVLYVVDEVTISDEQMVSIVAYNYDEDSYFHADWGSGATAI